MQPELSNMMKFLCDRYIKDDPDLMKGIQEERWNSDIAQIVYDLRQQAGLSHKELADKAGIAESILEQIEEADYEGNVMETFRKIITALDKKIEIHVVG